MPFASCAAGSFLRGDRAPSVAGLTDREGTDLERPAAPERPAGGVRAMADSVLPARPPGPHPTPEQLYRARNSPRTAEAERWLAHAGACALCTEELLRQ